MNHKKLERIYSQLELQVRKRKRKRFATGLRSPRPKAEKPNEVWSIDFVFDWLLTKRKLKCLTIVDDFSKQSVGILVSQSISGLEVARFIEELPEKPKRIRSDNGPEFVSVAFLDCLDRLGIEHEAINPGKPNENAYIESFNSRLRDECLNEHVFRNLDDAKRKIEIWRKEYNELHPHSSIGMKTPNQFAKEWSDCYTKNAS